ncbi:uncharacterized protein PV09_06727 [Verruconis gallopava]|uniref:FAD-binding PCMH-type domain-containing protein n=1 Tax=Verruconis gallopava TaxID=253628 RepID=A0A0D2ARR6_9PEZI|nr:uncharacterized protein PV09_06727 [Verruconis gallopava]KIW01879.1 hypothetical protein PV09_06727 [Verruconis gallopava]
MKTFEIATSILFTLFLPKSALSTVIDGSECKCIPGDPCWPSMQDWSAFNETINGSLIASVPPAEACYPGKSYNADACNLILASWFDSNWHAKSPISIDYPEWANNSCNPIFPNGTSLTGDPNSGSRGCTLGYYPVYAVNASSAEMISTAVKWAASRNIRLVVKNTGHSFAGRSTGYASLSIWTHNMRGFQYHDDWKPIGCSSTNSTEKQKAATLAAGMQDRDVYALSHEHGAIVVGGSNPSVGIMGWFPGGGHGPLSSSYGMGADNLLQAKVVLANGDVVIANECQHSDLYWALRGGGSGTFGVIVEATMMAFPTPQTTITLLNVTSLPGDGTNLTSRWWQLIAELHADFPAIKDGGAQGYYVVSAPPIVALPSFEFFTYHYESDKDTVDSLWRPVLDRLNEHKDFVNYTFFTYTAPTFFDIWNASTGQAFEAVATGGGWMASRLLTRRALTEDIQAVAKAFEKAGPILIGHMIANDKNRRLDSALNPGWRDTVVHVVVVAEYRDGDPPDVKEKAKEETMSVKAYALKQISPEAGAYFNEMNPYEPDWQYTFFSKNYPRLRRIKDKYDPTGVLWCLSCVGSEDWIEKENKRLCRPSWW